MAIIEAFCLDGDKVLTDLLLLNSMKYTFSLNGKSDCKYELFTYLTKCKSLPKTAKVFISLLFPNSQISFFIVKSLT